MGITADSAPIALLVAHADALPDWVDPLGLNIIQRSDTTTLKHALTVAGADVALALENGLAIALMSERGPRALTPQETLLCLLYAIGRRAGGRRAVAVTTVADFPGLEEFATEWGLPVVRTLPGHELVDDELAQRSEEIAFGATVEEGELMLTLTDETMCLACTALVEALRQGLDLSDFLSGRLDGRRYRTGDVHVSLGSPVDCALRLMDIRTDENRLFCHMMVEEPVDYLPGLPMPGDDNRHLRSSDLIDWTLSDTSHVVFMADESRDDVVVRIQAHGDSLAEADIVYDALAHEALTYVRQGPQDLSEED